MLKLAVAALKACKYSPLLHQRRYASKLPPLPPLNEDDIEETRVRGSGPGGQAINKTNISVSLLHKPTGIRVQCHQTRSLVWNQSLARKILRERLDLALNPGVSRAEAKWSQAAAKKAAQARKRKRKERDKQSVEETGESDA